MKLFKAEYARLKPEQLAEWLREKGQLNGNSDLVRFADELRERPTIGLAKEIRAKLKKKHAVV